MRRWGEGLSVARRSSIAWCNTRQGGGVGILGRGQERGVARRSKEEEPFKEDLRRLFKLIHPDLFHNHPSQQATNQQSFQLLQEYLDVAKGLGNSPRHIYSFVFFVRRDANKDTLKRVEVSLPSPQVQHLFQEETDLLPGTKVALEKLFTACGLSSFRFQGASTNKQAWANLSSLFQLAAEIQRKNEISAKSMEQHLTVIRNALILGRRIRASFRPPLLHSSLEKQSEALEKLASALDRCPEVDVGGHIVFIGDRSGIDALGNLWLKHDHDADSWAEFLRRVDLNEAINSKRESARRRLLELKVAKLMEVEMVFAHDALAVKPSYLAFLTKVVGEAAECGAVGGGKFFELPIRIVDDNTPNPTASVDQTLGYLSVPLCFSLKEIYAFIQEQGGEALEIRRSGKSSEEHMERVKLIARKKLRLRHLVFNKALRSEECLAGCMRLIHFAPELEKYTEGLSLCLSDKHELPVEGTQSHLHLKWNFSLSEL